MKTPYGPVINLGSEEQPNFAGAAEAVGYARGIWTALDAVKSADENWGPPAEEVIRALLL